MLKSIFRGAATALALGAVLSGPALADDDQEAKLRRLVETKIMDIFQREVVVDSIKVQNHTNKQLNERQIVRLDKIWRDEVKRAGGALINEVMNNPLSAYLKQVKKDSGNLFAEIYVMDNRGLNVGQSDVTPDYWQGDEGKWQKTFLAGRGAVRISKGKIDTDTNQHLSRVTVTIVDPETNRIIGAATIAVNIDELS